MLVFSCLHLFLLLFSANVNESEAFMRIVGGYLADIESFPFMASLLINYKPMCGAAIISPNYVVTAAHCVPYVQHYSIKAGIDDLCERNEYSIVKRVYLHPNYNIWTADYDVAVLELATPLNYSSKIRNVALPKYSLSVPLHTGTVLGWGLTYNPEEKQNRLRAVDLQVFKERTCQLYYGSHSITESMFCAGHMNPLRDSCNGDSGGPFIIGNVLYGVVSFGSAICGTGIPGVYSKIPLVVNWIRDISGVY